MQEATAPTEEKVASTPEATPEATPEVTEPTPEKGEVAATEETAEATAEATEAVITAEPFDPTQYDADHAPHRESFGKFREEEQAKGWAQARESFTGEFTAQKERSDGLTRLYEGATQAYKTTLGRLNKALQAGQVDQDALTEVFQDPNFTRATQAIGEEAQKHAHDQGVAEGRGVGANSAMEGVVAIGARVLGRQSLAQEFIPKIQSARTQEDAVSMIESFVKSVKDIGYQQGLADNKSGTRHADDLSKRKGEKPVQNVGSTGGGGVTKQQLIDMEPDDPKMPGPAERARIFAATE